MNAPYGPLAHPFGLLRDSPSPVQTAGKTLAVLGATLSTLTWLAACTVPQPSAVGRTAPPGARPGTCWSTVIEPARIETITRQVEVTPARIAADGRVLSPATFATETHQEIVSPRQERFFQTPCPVELTPSYAASLQRALKARGHYNGPITGVLDAATGRAIRAYQAPLGIDSSDLSLEAARKLGLSVLRR